MRVRGVPLPSLALLASLIGVSSLVVAREARAACPDSGSPSTAVCQPHAATFVPTAEGVAFFPRDDSLGPFLGGGVELLLFTWSNSADTFGPAQGKIRFDVAGLASTRENVKAMVFCPKHGPQIAQGLGRIGHLTGGGINDPGRTIFTIHLSKMRPQIDPE